MRPILMLLPAVALPILLAGCTVPPPAETGPALPAPEVCKAGDYKGLVGQSRSVLDAMLLPAGTRIIGPNDPVTADFRPDRVNIEVGAGDRIEKVSCF